MGLQEGRSGFLGWHHYSFSLTPILGGTKGQSTKLLSPLLIALFKATLNLFLRPSLYTLSWEECDNERVRYILDTIILPTRPTSNLLATNVFGLYITSVNSLPISRIVMLMQTYR